MKRIVLDTNVFVAGAYNADSASRELVQACWQGRLTLVVSPAIRREYEKILPRAIRDPDQRQWAAAVIERAETVEIEDPPPRVVEGDPEDDKFIATAVAGRVDALISNDQQVLQVGTHQGIRVLRPVEAVESLMPNKPFKMKGAEIRTLVQGYGACIASDMITVNGMQVGYMYRELPNDPPDSGWRFFAGTETEEFLEDASNFEMYYVNTICNYDPEVIPFLDSPPNVAYERTPEGFREVEYDEE